ncbi:hypothetical protein ARMGADRAFT_1037406 [Armillaria gallica]|uniref:Uncharacterized protein n=1 Tax=Armillaria gallica TaxID=47427 RepID=A0A2H3CLY2_ARMGA|nr:hypothetical protein ARMGADRAFT_1037406 [Armillaria gallica]
MKAAHCINKPDSLRLQIRLDCNMINLFLAYLDALPMNFEQVCLTVSETQRVTRLLCASVNYIQIYKPRMDGLVERDPKVCDPMIMGAFVEDATMLQHFFCARIPVWTMQLLEEVAVYHINVLTDIETPDSWLVLDQPQLKLQSMYTGAPNKPIILMQPNAPLALSTREDVWFSPYHNQSRSEHNKVLQSHSNVSGLTDPSFQNLVEALRCHASKTSCFGEWWALLTLPYLWDSVNTNTKSALVHKKVQHLMAGCCGEFDGSIDVNNLQGYWQGKEFGTLTANNKKEILWEISEMGFCLEVHALDQCASVVNVNDEACKADIG